MRKYIIAVMTSAMLLSGCSMNREAPTAVSVEDAIKREVSIKPISTNNESKLVSVMAQDAEYKQTVKVTPISAKNSNVLGLQTGTSDVGKASTYQTDYIICYKESLTDISITEISVQIVNISERAFDMTGIVIRAKCTNEKVLVTCPTEVTNNKKLAPGESLSFKVSVSNSQQLIDKDSITLTLYEVPILMDESGGISKRGSCQINLGCVVSTENIGLRTFYTKELRAHDGSGPSDLRSVMIK